MYSFIVYSATLLLIQPCSAIVANSGASSFIIWAFFTSSFIFFSHCPLLIVPDVAITPILSLSFFTLSFMYLTVGSIIPIIGILNSSFKVSKL